MNAARGAPVMLPESDSRVWTGEAKPAPQTAELGRCADRGARRAYPASLPNWPTFSGPAVSFSIGLSPG